MSKDEMSGNYSRYLWLILTLVLLAGVLVIRRNALQTPTYTIDSYFYLSKAEQLVEGHGLRTTWNDGIDTKYFPGYSVFLALPFALGFSFLSLQLVAYIAASLLMFRIAAALELDRVEQALATTALAAHPIVIKWFSLPMAEGVALVLCLLSFVLFLRYMRSRHIAFLFAACVVGGIATITRVESLFLILVFAVLAFPERKLLPKGMMIAGAIVFVLPLAAYWSYLRGSAGQSFAYVSEFRHTFLRFDLLKNFAYNVWVAFGLIHWPERPSGFVSGMPVLLGGIIWILLGEIVFLGGLLFALSGRLGSKARGAGFLFLIYALAHSLWYYRYERFMLLALPLAVIVWAAGGRAAVLLPERHRVTRTCVIALLQLLIAGAGLYWGNYYSVEHSAALQQDTRGVRFQEIAERVNELNSRSHSAVLTDLGPHLAYYVASHTYLDTNYRDYWHKAFLPEHTLEEMQKLGIEFVVTTKDLDGWLETHMIPVGARVRFKRIEGDDGVSIIQYSGTTTN